MFFSHNTILQERSPVESYECAGFTSWTWSPKEWTCLATLVQALAASRTLQALLLTGYLVMCGFVLEIMFVFFSSRKSSTFQCGEHVGGGQQEPQIVPPRPQREISHRGLVWIDLYEITTLVGQECSLADIMSRSNWTLLLKGQVDSCWIKKTGTYICWIFRFQSKKKKKL